MDEGNVYRKETLWVKFVHILEDIWPSIYRTINTVFFAVIDFIKGLISTLFNTIFGRF